MLQERSKANGSRPSPGVPPLPAFKSGEEVAILSETQSRPVIVQLAELALLSLDARPFHLVVPTPRQRVPVPVRSTGARTPSKPAAGIAALAQAGMVVDCTVEGLLHAPELPQNPQGRRTRPDDLRRTPGGLGAAGAHAGARGAR